MRLSSQIGTLQMEQWHRILLRDGGNRLPRDLIAVSLADPVPCQLGPATYLSSAQLTEDFQEPSGPTRMGKGASGRAGPQGGHARAGAPYQRAAGFPGWPRSLPAPCTRLVRAPACAGASPRPGAGSSAGRSRSGGCTPHRAQVAQQPQPGSRTSSSQPTGGRQRASFSSEQGGQWMASSPRLGPGPAASSSAAMRQRDSMTERGRGAGWQRETHRGSARRAWRTRLGGRGDTRWPPLADKDGAEEVSKLAGRERAWPPRRCAASSARPRRRAVGGQGAERLPGTGSPGLYTGPWPHPQRRPSGGGGAGERETERRLLGGGGAVLSRRRRCNI